MTFSLYSIEEALKDSGIPYEIIGSSGTYERFCSFRCVQKSGIYFIVGNIKYPEGIEDSLIICDIRHRDLALKNNTLIIVEDPQATYYKLLNSFYPKKPCAGIHPTAIIDPSAYIEENVEIGPYCVIGKATLRKGTYLQGNVTVNDNSFIGRGVTIEPFTVIGATGVAWVYDKGSGERIIQPQIGGVSIGDSTFIGSNVTVVRGSVNENTEIGNECMIAHGSKIGHGCRIGDYTHFANNVAIAGNVDIAAWSFLGSGAVIRPHIKVGEGTIVAAGAVVVKSVLESDHLLVGVPAKARKCSLEELNGIPLSLMEKRRKLNGT